jgi:hypothetical protein
MTLTMSPRTSQRLNVRAIRERYTAAKRQLARRDWPDMNAYADAKTMVIQKITADAEQWARATSRTQRTENQGVQ